MFVILSYTSKYGLLTKHKVKMVGCINNSCHFGGKYAWIFVCGQYLFQEVHSRKIVRYKEQIYPRTNIWAYFHTKWRLLSLLFFKSFSQSTQFWKLGEYSWIFPSFSWGIFGHVMGLDQSHGSKKIWWIIMANIQPSWPHAWSNKGFIIWLSGKFFSRDTDGGWS